MDPPIPASIYLPNISIRRQSGLSKESQTGGLSAMAIPSAKDREGVVAALSQSGKHIITGTKVGAPIVRVGWALCIGVALVSVGMISAQTIAPEQCGQGP